MQEVTSIKSGKTIGGPFKVFFGKLGSKPLLLAFLLNLAAFLLCTVCFDAKYEVSDDYITDAVLSGAFGTGYEPQLLFSNVILGYFLVFLYSLIPAVSFYFVLLLLLDFLTATAVLYLLFKKKVNTITICLACIFLFYYSKDLYVVIQFTKASTIAGIAGGLLILYGLWEADKHKLRYIVLGTLLMLAGTMVRFSTIFFFAAFLVIAFFACAISHASKSGTDPEKKKAKPGFIADFAKRFAVCVVIIGMMFGAEYLGGWICSLDETHADFNRFHAVRCGITDSDTPSFESVEKEYEKLGLDVIDYYMLNSWNFLDRNVYPDELLQKVAVINRNAVKQRSFAAAADALISRQTLVIPAAAAVYLFAVFTLLFSKRKFYPLVLLVTSIAMFFGLVFYGRIMYRVEWSVYFCAASCLLTGFSYDDDGLVSKLERSDFGKKTLKIGLAALVAVLGLMSFVPDVLTKVRLLGCSDSEYRETFENSLRHSGEYAFEKAAFPSIQRKISPNLIDYMQIHSDRYFMVDFCTGIQVLYYNYNPWIRPEYGLFDRYSYFGGCTMHHPGERSAINNSGIDPDNPYKSMLNDNVYLVDNCLYQYRILYFRKYYIHDAKMKKVNEIDGYQIWKVYLPE
ncbi:MAG: hypothetical protein K5869_00725 [Saccharofermentans sp.]|nr:hypothetical protein [Saccharofermentans sp.]